MAKLNQIIAVVNGKKTQSQKALGEIYKSLQKGSLFDGINRAYTPSNEDGDKLPPESKHVQLTVKDAIASARVAMTELLDVTATQDIANCSAKADVKIGEQVIVQGVPVTYLLFLEKRLNDLATFVGHIPVLDPADEWDWSEQSNCYVAKPIETVKTKKTPKTHVLYEATKEHVAQCEVYHEDVLAGTWKTIKMSGAVPAQEKADMLSKVRQLQEAVKFAREEANGIEVENKKVASGIFDFIFG